MTDILKVLGQRAAAAAATEELYTVPDLSSTTTSSLVVCNRTAGTLTFRVSVHMAGAVADDKQYLFYDTPIEGNSTITAVLGMTLDEADVIKTYASATGLTFQLFGVETS
jgi:hypothetical protein